MTNTVTLGDMLTEVTGAITDIIPDFGVYVAAGVVISLAAYTVRRFIGAGL